MFSTAKQDAVPVYKTASCESDVKQYSCMAVRTLDSAPVHHICPLLYSVCHYVAIIHCPTFHIDF